MKNIFTKKSSIHILFFLLLSIFISACGSSSTKSTEDPNQPLEYSGSTDPAAITAKNAVELAGKSVAVGFMADLENGAEAQTVATAKSLVASDKSISKAANEAARQLLNQLYGDIVTEGNVLPEIYIELMNSTDFPNNSDESSFTEAVTTTDDKIFTVVQAFTDASHISGNHNPTGSESDFRIVDTLNGTVTTVYTFEYEADTPPSNTWDDETTDIEKLESLINAKIIPVIDSATCSAFTHNRIKYGYPVIETIDPDLFNGQGGYYEYRYTDTASYKMEGNFTEDETFNNTYEDGYGGITNKIATVFTGDLSLNASHTEGYGGNFTEYASLAMTGGNFSNTRTIQTTRTNADGLINETNTNVALNPNPLPYDKRMPDRSLVDLDTEILPTDIEVSLTGETVEYTYETSYKDEKSSLKIALTDAANSSLLVSKTGLVDKCMADNDDFNTEYKKTTVDFSTEIKGSAELNYSYTVANLSSPITQTAKIILTDGKFTASKKLSYLMDYIYGELEEETTKATDYDNHLKNIYDDSIIISASISGSVAITQDAQFFNLKGGLSAEYTDKYYRDTDDTDGDLFTNTEALAINISNLTIQSNLFDATLNGTVTTDYDYDYAPDTVTIDLDIVSKDNAADVMYHFNNYAITIPYIGMNPKGCRPPAVDITGRFFHSEMGYVDISTIGSPILFPGCIEEGPGGISKGPGGFPFLPFEGTVNITGADNTSAALTVFTTNEEGGYTVTADTDGDGTTDFGPVAEYWPSVNIFDLWITNLFFHITY